MELGIKRLSFARTRDSTESGETCDSEYLTKLNARDHAAVTEVVRQNNRPLLRAALAHGLAQDQAEEVVQATWESFFSALSGFEGRSSVETFLFGILYNKIREHRRYANRFSAEGGKDPVADAQFTAEGWWAKEPIDPERFAAAAETREHLLDCLEALPETQRMAFYLREVQGEKSPRICKILSVTDTNLGVLIYRAKSRLRLCLEKKSPK